eukprot:1023722-Amphidinium_carterae.1
MMLKCHGQLEFLMSVLSTECMEVAKVLRRCQIRLRCSRRAGKLAIGECYCDWSSREHYSLR